MSASNGYQGRWSPGDRKVVQVGDHRVLLNEHQVEALGLECEAALREWSEQRAQALFDQIEDETFDQS